MTEREKGEREREREREMWKEIVPRLKGGGPGGQCKGLFSIFLITFYLNAGVYV